MYLPPLLPHSVPVSSKFKYIPFFVEVSDSYKIDSPHWHDHIQIWYVLSGSMKQCINGKEYIQKPGSCAVILPYSMHSINTRDSDGVPKIISLSFPDRFVNNLGHPFFSYFNEYAHFENLKFPVFCEFSEQNKKLADELVIAMMDEFSKHKDMSFIKLGELLVSFLRLLCSDSESSSPAKQLTIEHSYDIANAIQFMNENYSKKIEINDFCKVSMMSRRRFAQNFKDITGKTALEFLQSIRLAHAVLILMTSDKTTEEIAKMVGLSDKTYLSRIFRKKFGITPLQYREHMRNFYDESGKEWYKRWSWFDENDFEPYDYSAR